MLIHYTEDGRTQFCSEKTRVTKPNLTDKKAKVTCSRCLKKFKEPVHLSLGAGFILCSSKIPKRAIRITKYEMDVTCDKCKKNFHSGLTATHFINPDKEGKPLCSNAKKIDPRLKLTTKKEKVTCIKCKKKMTSSNSGIAFIRDNRHGYCLQLDRFTILTLGDNMEDQLTYLKIMTKTKQSSTSTAFVSSTILTQFIPITKVKHLRNSFLAIKEKHNRNEIYVQDVADYF